MKIIKYLLISIISSITNILPISYYSHITLYKNIFNTKIFNSLEVNSLFILAPSIAIIINLFKKTPKLKTILKNKKNYLRNLTALSIMILVTSIIHIIFTNYQKLSIKNIPLLFIITSLILLFIKSKNNSNKINDLTFKNYLFITLFNFLSIINGLPILLINLLACNICKLNKNHSLKLSLLLYLPTLLIDTYPSFIFLLNSSDIIYIFISLIIGTFISLKELKYLKRLIKQNKLYKLSIYLLLTSIFIMYWFR